MISSPSSVVRGGVVSAITFPRRITQRLGGCISGLQRIAEQKREMDTLRQQVRHLGAVIDSYEASTSWRVTAPLRSVVRLMKSANM